MGGPLSPDCLVPASPLPEMLGCSLLALGSRGGLARKQGPVSFQALCPQIEKALWVLAVVSDSSLSTEDRVWDTASGEPPGSPGELTVLELRGCVE